MAVRNAGVRAFADSQPTRAAFWPGHPSVVIGLGMEEIGQASAQRRTPSERTLEQIIAAARAAPLAPEPFLVSGIRAQLAGDPAIAERAFVAARARAPRAPAPRYFLAQHYLVGGRSAEGLREVATLARIIPRGVISVAPTLAAFAKTPGAAPQLRQLFRGEPDLAHAVLNELAQDATNAELVLSLATAAPTGGDRAPEWAQRLVNSLLAAGEYDRAYALWRTAARVPASAPGIFDAQFRGSKAPPPFNWSLVSSSVGLAEPAGNGSLRVLFYGRENAALAGQLLVLEPGDYTLSMRVAGRGDAAGGLTWTVLCQPDKQRLLDMRLQPVRGDHSAAFTVPPGCPAQQLELSGAAPDVAKQLDVTISNLQLRRVR